jgi:hypothetical protein
MPCARDLRPDDGSEDETVASRSTCIEPSQVEAEPDETGLDVSQLNDQAPNGGMIIVCSYLSLH